MHLIIFFVLVRCQCILGNCVNFWGRSSAERKTNKQQKNCTRRWNIYGDDLMSFWVDSAATKLNYLNKNSHTNPFCKQFFFSRFDRVWAKKRHIGIFHDDWRKNKKKYDLMTKKTKNIWNCWRKMKFRTKKKCHRANSFRTGLLSMVACQFYRQTFLTWLSVFLYEKKKKMQLCYLTYKKVKIESLRLKHCLHYLIMRKHFAKKKIEKAPTLIATDKATHENENENENDTLHITKTS